MLEPGDLEKLPDEDNPQPPDGKEVSTGFVTKGMGWSGATTRKTTTRWPEFDPRHP